jgi:2-polyprenyl-3-methyl-5-hydroxy-6-metoxy-1,4-benzoquinol methylase
MMPRRIWDFWASRYERLWAQRFALKPAREMIIRHLDEVAPHAQRILDAGCGVGQLAYELALHRPSSTITAIDYCQSMVEAAEKRHAHVRIRYRHSSIDRIDNEGPFDVIVMSHAFPYFPNKNEALCRMISMLNPRGRLILVHATIENFYDMLFLIFVRFTVSGAQYFSAGRLSSMIRHAGFTLGTVRPMKRFWLIPSIYMIEGIRE